MRLSGTRGQRCRRWCWKERGTESGGGWAPDPHSLRHGALGLGFEAPPHPIIMPKHLPSGRLPGLPCFPTSVCARARAHTHSHTHTPGCAGPLSRASEPGHSGLYQVLTRSGSTEPKDLPILQMRELRHGAVDGFTKVSQDPQV